MNDLIEFIFINDQAFLNESGLHIGSVHETDEGFDCGVYDRANNPVQVVTIPFIEASEKFANSIHYFTNQAF